ncbi:uncharacterized protein [Typha latifolia]|uniref:uncharacterized protein isoform X1 n=1 Tax=Typha latifolia TaxID=4733 RepID=UPI003C2DDCA5
MISVKSITALGVSYSYSSTKNSSLSTATCSRSSPPVCCSLGSQRVSVEPLRIEAKKESSPEKEGVVAVEKETKDAGHNGGTRAKEERRIPGIHVPREKYISVPKGELLDVILALFDSKEAAEEFARVARCLDAILHAEHKVLLEEMREFYLLTHHEEDKETIERSSFDMEEAGSTGNHMVLDDFNFSGKDTTDSCKNAEDDKTMAFLNSLDLKSLLGSSPWLDSNVPVSESRVAFATSFQRSFMKLLHDAQFEELSERDLLLTYALNSDYLLTLPIYVDWKKASESKAIIFRRGYATERQKGLLIVEKLDYLQSKLLQSIFFSLSKPLKNIGEWLNQALKSSTGVPDLQIWIEKMKRWLKEQYFPESSLYYKERTSEGQLGSDQVADKDLPIWIAAQKAVSLYEGLLSPVGPRGRLIRKLLTWTGLVPSLPEASVTHDMEKNYLEAYLRPNFLPRITLANIWEPATRESCGNNLVEILKASFTILFQQSTLQEPAFQELILLYTDEASQSKARDKIDMLPLQLKIYERIPIPDLPVVFPHKKLSFRILDTVRLDAATIIGLSAYLVNYKFLSIASSPSALFLDVVAVSALVIYVFRVVLGYKQTWDRYQLLVNKTLYEKTLASGFGSVHFLLDASEQQKYKEALLVYALLLCPGKYQVSCRKSITMACEQFMYNKFKEKIEMPINSAMDTLLRLGLLIEIPVDKNLKIVALPCSKACEILKKRWNSLLEEKT